MHTIDCYKEQNNEIELTEFIQKHRNLVKRIALHLRKRLPSSIELDDLLQSGFVGLLESRTSYNPEAGASFETYASIRIHGAMIDSLRKNSWASRDALKNMKRMSVAIHRVEQRKQRPATIEEIAEELGITLEEHIQMSQQISICNVLSLENVEENNHFLSDEAQNPANETTKEAMLDYVKKALIALPEREQLVLSLYYLEEFNFKQISEILNLTEARICQLHSHAIARIRARLDYAK